MDDQCKMYLKTSSFYIKESERLLACNKNAKTQEEKIKYLEQLMHLRSKISREIKDISNFCDQSED